MEELEAITPYLVVDGNRIDPTKEGNKALKQGRSIQHRNRRVPMLGNPGLSAEQIESIGGKATVLWWFGAFYGRLFADPRMAVLFDTRSAEANVSAAEHGKRLGLLLLNRWTGDTEYFTVTGTSNIFTRLQMAHERAKGCPMRGDRRYSFTKDQRDSWLGHVYLAGRECGIEDSLCNVVVDHLASAMAFYGPFDRAGSKEA